MAGSLFFTGPESAGMTVFAHFSLDTINFGDGPQQAMVNFHIEDLEVLVAQLAAAVVRIDPKRRDFEYWRFAWRRDLEGNRVKLR